jgi:hypothetical protein
MVKSGRAKRMAKHHKRNRGSGALNLVSLMDIFTILVFFLLVNSSDVETLPNTKDLQLPESIAEEKAKETVVILIGEQDIIVQGTPVAKVADVMKIKGNDIPAQGDGNLHGIGLRTDFSCGTAEELRQAQQSAGIAIEAQG